MKKIISVIAGILGFISFFPSALVIFGPEMAAGVMSGSLAAYLVYLMPIAWITGLICYMKGINEEAAWPVYLSLVFWIIPWIIILYVESI